MYLSAHRELRASPRKPNVATVLRSEKSRSLEVWCFSVSDSKFSGATPLPLSATSTSSEPCSFSLTSCVCVCRVCMWVGVHGCVCVCVGGGEGGGKEVST